MYLIDSAQNAGTLQAPAAAGTAGYFQDSASPGTVVPADWLNTIMCELINVVEAAGITPEKPTTTSPTEAARAQVLAAIQALIADAIALIPAPGAVAFPTLWARYTAGNGANSGEVLPLDAWTQRKLTSTPVNTIVGASLATNQITLPAGTYKISAVSTSNLTGGGVGATVSRLRDVTDGATLIVNTESQSNGGANADAILHGQFTLAGTRVVQLESYALVAACNGGLAAGTGEVEVYVDVYLEKIG